MVCASNKQSYSKEHILSIILTTTSLRMTNNTLSKLIDKVSCWDHKRTWQGVLNAFLHYLYNTYMAYANNK